MMLFAVAATAIVGLILGVLIANWRFGGVHFEDPDVLRAARLIIGGFGAILFGYMARTYVVKRAIKKS
jgi:hypothetical protein